MSRMLDIRGCPVDGEPLRLGVIGCGSHAFRNIYPCFQFLPVQLEAVCDLDAERAEMFARRFGARRQFQDHRKMLEDGGLDLVVVVLNYDERGRPKYPQVVADVLNAGCHAWFEKPPATTAQEMLDVEALCRKTGRKAMTGFKKVFMPANAKAIELTRRPEFGRLSSMTLRYPMHIPQAHDLRAYLEGNDAPGCVGFLDHLCHPVSLMLAVAGYPQRLYYAPAHNRGGFALFEFDAGHVATIHFTIGQTGEAPLERTVIVGHGASIEIENNLRVTYYRPGPDHGYGVTPSWYLAEPEQAPNRWEPEFSLGQLHNKGIMLQGFYGELRYFCDAVRNDTPIEWNHPRAAAQATAVFAAFAQGPGRVITLPTLPQAE